VRDFLSGASIPSFKSQSPQSTITATADYSVCFFSTARLLEVSSCSPITGFMTSQRMGVSDSRFRRAAGASRKPSQRRAIRASPTGGTGAAPPFNSGEHVH
jgi:hypothetical protein